MGVVEHVVVPQSHSVPLLATVPSMLEHVAPKVVTGNKQRIRRHGKSLFILSVRSHGYALTEEHYRYRYFRSGCCVVHLRGGFVDRPVAPQCPSFTILLEVVLAPKVPAVALSY